MNNVAGISSASSQRAMDLKLKCEYLQELHGSDKGIVFATGTPISNSMTEMYTMQSYLQPRVLQETGLNFFDSWAAPHPQKDSTKTFKGKHIIFLRVIHQLI